MRCAVIAVSKEGVKSANLLQNYVDCDVYVKKIYAEFCDNENANLYDKLKDLVAEIFNIYDGIVFISAVGIAVRIIAPHIKNKLTDPAVIVIDESGKYVVSLLSGHIGGANFFAKNLAKILNAEPIITTATDSHELIAPDLIAPLLGVNPYPKSEILNVNNAILNGEKISYFIDENLSHANFYKSELEKYNIKSKIVNFFYYEEKNHAVFFTDRYEKKENILYMIPQKLIAGIGCRKDAKKEMILSALKDATEKIGKNLSFVDLIASTSFKKNEKGILDAAVELKTETKFFSNEKLQSKIDEYRLKESEFVKKTIGVGNVAEAAALAAAKQPKFALKKTRYEKVTVALVWEKYTWWE